MARFDSVLEEQRTTRVSAAVARARLADPRLRADHIEEAERCDHPAPDKLRVVLKPHNHGPVSFQGRYTLRFTTEGDVVRWQTVDDSNLVIRGEARVTADGAGARVAWKEVVETELPINRVVAKAVAPVASRMMVRGMRRSMEGLLDAVDRAG